MADNRTHLFEYFPGNFVWSQQVNSMIDMANWGASSMGEIDQVGRKLRGREGDGEAWFTEWDAMAHDQQRKAEAAAAANHALTAGTYYLHAGVYHLYAERFIPPCDRKRESYRKAMHCFEEGYKRRFPNITRVEVPYEGGKTLPAFFMKAPGEGKKPTVVCFDGLDSSKEMSILYIGVELANRGYHTLAIDGPGQGEALRLRNIPSRYDYEVPGTAAFDCVAARPDVDAQRIGVMAFSLGGYYAPRMAAFEKRYAACVAWGAHWDYHAIWLKRRKHMEAGGTNTSSAMFQLPWVMGTPDMDSAIKKIENFKLEGIADKIECPILIVHGENDTIVPVEIAHQLNNAVTRSRKKTFKVFTTADGGSEHCHGDNRIVGANYVADWVTDNL
ncbi:MAG: alpha/beta hydrolase [Betaproteobacteria bacterium]|nr:alpha/beta hydrolase [Betaproteobacteria bacterium]